MTVSSSWASSGHTLARRGTPNAERCATIAFRFPEGSDEGGQGKAAAVGLGAILGFG